MQTRTFVFTMAAVTALIATSLAETQTASAADTVSKKEAHSNNHVLSHTVRQSLTKVKGLDSSRIHVLARGSTVTLEGTAPDQSQIDSAASAAAKVAGVSHVDNRLAINEPGN